MVLDVIESEEQIMLIAKNLKNFFQNMILHLFLKLLLIKPIGVLRDSYRGLGINKGLSILKKVKEELNIPRIT